MSFSPRRELWGKKYLNSLCYIEHDHLSNTGEKTYTSGTQNIGVKIFFCFKVFFLNTSQEMGAATVEPCSPPDAAQNFLSFLQ